MTAGGGGRRWPGRIRDGWRWPGGCWPGTRRPASPPGTPHRPQLNRNHPAPSSSATSPARATARNIARITGCSERTIRQFLTSAGLRQQDPLPDGGIDPHWLREHYQDRQRSLKDLAAETGVPVEALAAAARKAGIRVRHGITGRAHPLGGPGAFPADVWNAFTRPGAEQRIRRLLTLPGLAASSLMSVAVDHQFVARQLGR
jgi:hypothetical protein